MRQIFEYHPVFGYRFVPGLKTRVPTEGGGYLIQVNSDGFRNDGDFQNARADGRRRVLLFGDSFTAGDGVSNGKRYGDLLAKGLPGVEVYNFGLSGTGTDQQFLIYNEYASRIEHDLVVIGLLVENIRRVAARYRYYQNDKGERVCYAKPYFELIGGEMKLGHSPVPREPVDESRMSAEDLGQIDRVARFRRINRLLIKTNTIKLAYKVANKRPYPQYDSPAHPDWLLMSTILERWIRQSPAPVLLVPIPFYYFIEEMADPSGYQARFREFADRANCFYHDPLDDLLGYPASERREFRFQTDVHFSAQGHEALAKSLAVVVDEILNEMGTRI